jgi:hypothetical protein
LPKVGQNGTDICVNLKVKLGIKMTEIANEMVRNFNNFKRFVIFAMKKLEALLILVEKF